MAREMKPYAAQGRHLSPLLAQFRPNTSASMSWIRRAPPRHPPSPQHTVELIG